MSPLYCKVCGACLGLVMVGQIMICSKCNTECEHAPHLPENHFSTSLPDYSFTAMSATTSSSGTTHRIQINDNIVASDEFAIRR